jgi:hypothetical protein
MKPYRYKTAEQSREPGYLAKRFKALLRLQRMQAAKSNVQPLKKIGK